MELGITGGEEDGVNNEDVAQASCFCFFAGPVLKYMALCRKYAKLFEFGGVAIVQKFTWG